ncbi:hypothetical protein PAPHI01_1555 [Pancytospora philotis]|nr:hypothetical protein PAPHI01_1555 [Pancytospora philotis]
MLLGICHMLVSLVHGRPGDDVEMAVEESGSQRGTVQEGSATKSFFTFEEAELLEWLYARFEMLQFGGISIDNALAKAKRVDSRRHAVMIISSACLQNTLVESMEGLTSLVQQCCDIDTDEKRAVFELLPKLFTRECIEYARQDPYYAERAGYKRFYANFYKMELYSDRIRDILRELERPMDELLDSNWTPLPASSDA